MITMIDIRPVSDLRNHFPEIEAAVNDGHPIYLTKNGYGTMVLMSIAQYAALTEGIEQKLDEADRIAEENPERLMHEEVFGKARAMIGK